MVSRGARRIEIRGAGGGETSVCAVGDGAQPMAGPVCRIWARDGGRFVNRPYGDGGRIAAAVGPSIARPRIRRLLRQGRHRRADPHIGNSRPADAGRLFCVLCKRGNPFRQRRALHAAATSPGGGGNAHRRRFFAPPVMGTGSVFIPGAPGSSRAPCPGSTRRACPRRRAGSAAHPARRRSSGWSPP